MSAIPSRGAGARIARLVLSALAGIGFAASFPGAGLSLLVIPSHALLIVLTTTERPARAAFHAFFAGFIFHGLLLRWFAAAILDFSTLGPVIAAGAVLSSAFLLAGLMAIWGWASARLAARFGPVTGALCAALIWCGIEVARQRIPFPFPWGVLHAALSDLRPARAVAAWAGSWGVSVLAALAAASLSLAMERRRAALAGLAAVIGLTGLAWGARIVAPGTAHGRVTAAVLQAGLPKDADAQDELLAYEELTRRAAAEGATLVVWPESAVSYRVDQHTGYRARLEDLAEAHDVDIVITSVTRGESDEYFNSAALIRPGLGLAGLYAKRQLVPFGEYLPLRMLFGDGSALAAEAGDFTPGTTPALLPARAGKLGPLICYEVVFPGLAQEAARAGARALVTMTNDGWFGWTSGPRQHLVHGQLRAAENGLPLLRAANTGISVIVDRHGRNLGEIGLGESGFLVREVELGDAAPGAYAGPIVAWACATLAAAALVAAFFMPARRRDEPPARGGARPGPEAGPDDAPRVAPESELAASAEDHDAR